MDDCIEPRPWIRPPKTENDCEETGQLELALQNFRTHAGKAVQEVQQSPEYREIEGLKKRVQYIRLRICSDGPASERAFTEMILDDLENHFRFQLARMELENEKKFRP
jgi:hypothetical protein